MFAKVTYSLEIKIINFTGIIKLFCFPFFLVPVMGLGTATLMENTTFAVKTALEIGYR